MKTFLLPALSAALLLSACGGGSSAPSGKDTTAPTATLTRSISDADGIVVLTAAATDNVRVTKVEFYQGSTLLATKTTAPYTYSTSVTAARTGFTARAYDAAGNVGTSAAFDIVTPYQGVWGWGLVDDAGTVVDSGAVIFFDEGSLDSRVAGFGFYQNDAQSRTGFSLMGPLSAAGQLETIFSASTDTSGANYFFARDADAALGTYQGSATVEGAAVLFNADGTTGATLGFAMIQDSAVVPPIGGQALAKQSARERATSYLVARHSTPPALKVSSAVVKAAADALRRR